MMQNNLNVKIKTGAILLALATSFVALSSRAVFADANNSGTYQTPSLAEQRAALAQSLKGTMNHDMDSPLIYKVMIDRLERNFTNKGSFTQFEGQAYVGSDINKLWIKGEGQRLSGQTQEADIEAYYSRAIAPYWDGQIGARHDFSVGNIPGRNWLGLGIQGLAPYKFNTAATAYVGNAGRTALRLTGDYDLLITQRLIFWPALEFNFYGKDDPARAIGKGLANSRVVLRLRYEIAREFAPYVGIQWTNKYGQTARYVRENNGATSDIQLITGVRLWW